MEVSYSNEEMAARIRAGERDLIESLWTQVYGFIFQQAARYYHAAVDENGFARFDLDDLIQHSYFALIAAVKYFDPEKMTFNFLTVLKYTLKSAFAEVAGVRSSKRDALLFSISGDQPLNEDGDVTLFDTIADTRQHVDTIVSKDVKRQELQVVLEHCLQQLPERQSDILRRFYFNGMSQESIAKQFGCTGENIRQQRKNALHKLYDERAENGLLEYLDTHTSFYQKSSLKRFKSTGESIVETLVFKREQLAQKWLAKQKAKQRKR